MSSTTTDSPYSSRLGMTTPTPLPERVGAARITNCWPLRRTSLPPKLPTTMPLSVFLNRPCLARSAASAKRASPCRDFFFGFSTKNSATRQATIGRPKPSTPAALILVRYGATAGWSIAWTYW
ncbi:hypothetical protein D9M72_592050 [compost metagenome]